MTRSVARTIYLIKRAETACRNGLEVCLADIAMTPAQYTVMSLLAAQNDQSSADLARRAGVTPQSMSEIIAALERKRLISRSESPEHRRILTVHLTAQGRRALKTCDRRVNELEVRLLDGLSERDVETLRKFLYAVIHNGRLR
jgi:DNA-binding MarR family transcriptional regulator